MRLAWLTDRFYPQGGSTTWEAASLPLRILAMKNFKTACIFVDGENLRHSLMDLFKSDFDPSDYLPKTANWKGFFDYLVSGADSELRLRTYWYVVDEIDFWPYNLS